MFLRYCHRFVISILIFFAGCIGVSNTGDSEFDAEDNPKDRQISSFSITNVLLDGSPLGGELEVFVFNTTVRIETSPDDSINKVAEKIVDSINANVSLHKQAIKGEADGSKLILTNVLEYDLWICSTDKGIKIPKKPMDLVCGVKSDDHFLVFNWKNPGGRYDRIHIVESGIPLVEGLPGTSTSFRYDYLNPHGHVYDGKHIYRVVGVRGGTPSCPAMCEVFLKLP